MVFFLLRLALPPCLFPRCLHKWTESYSVHLSRHLGKRPRTGRAAGDISYDSVKSIRSVSFFQTLSALLIVSSTLSCRSNEYNIATKPRLALCRDDVSSPCVLFGSDLCKKPILALLCALLQRCCIHRGIHQEFVKFLNIFVIFFDKHWFWRICVGASVHWWKRPHLAFCVVLHGHFRMSHFKDGLLSLECSWIQHELKLN
jgi:hypothetical protein